MSIDMTKKLTGVTYKGQSMPIAQPAAKGVLDGTATSISCPELGVTNLKSERFREFTSLQSLDLTGVTDIPDYTAYNCTGLTSLILDNNTTNIGQYAFYNLSNANIQIDLNMNGSVGYRAFWYSRVRSLKGTYTNISNDCFTQSGSDKRYMQEIDIKVNGSIGSNAFVYTAGEISSFRLDPTSNITSLSGNNVGNSGPFAYFGRYRTNPQNNIFTFDFRNSSFTQVPYQCFGQNFSGSGCSYANIYFNDKMTNIYGSYAFGAVDHVNIYYQNVPTLSYTNAFQNATNFKNFFPYNLVQTAKTSTNWSSSTNGIINSIFGYAVENEFSLGDTLPVYDNNGYPLTWYSDSSLTTQVTTVSDPTQMYYCSVSLTRGAVRVNIAQYQATCSVSNTTTYLNGTFAQVGDIISITAVGDSGYPDPYIFTINGTNITSGDTYTISGTETSIDIVCIYYDGVNIPVNPIFADNTWDQIAVAISTGLHRSLWPITSGNTVSKQITLTDGTTMNLRLADSMANRYQFSDNSGYSQAVLEMDACIPTSYRMNATGTNAGGWLATEMSTQTMGIVYNMLPNDLKSLVKQVKVPSATSGSDSTLVYADNYCFLEAASEVYSSYSSYAYNEGAIYEYYNGTTDSIKIKRQNGNTRVWWLRSPHANNSSNFCSITGAGALGSVSPTNTRGVSVCLCIG